MYEEDTIVIRQPNRHHKEEDDEDEELDERHLSSFPIILRDNRLRTGIMEDEELYMPRRLRNAAAGNTSPKRKKKGRGGGGGKKEMRKMKRMESYALVSDQMASRGSAVDGGASTKGAKKKKRGCSGLQILFLSNAFSYQSASFSFLFFVILILFLNIL